MHYPLTAGIAIIFNIFVHHIIAILYKDLSYEERYSNSTVFMIIVGIMSIIISKYTKGQNYTIMSGLLTGGIILIITAVIANWDNCGDKIKLAISGTALIGAFYLSKKYNNKEIEIINNNEDTIEEKKSEEIKF